MEEPRLRQGREASGHTEPWKVQGPDLPQNGCVTWHKMLHLSGPHTTAGCSVRGAAQGGQVLLGTPVPTSPSGIAPLLSPAQRSPSTDSRGEEGGAEPPRSVHQRSETQGEGGAAGLRRDEHQTMQAGAGLWGPEDLSEHARWAEGEAVL